MKIVLTTIMFTLAALQSIASVKITGDDRQNILEPDANGALPAKIVNANGNPVSVDTVTRAIIGITYSHHEIHGGSHYTYGYTNTLGDGESDLILITVADSTKWPHMLYDFSGELDTIVEVYEGATNTAGASLICINNNRNSTNTPLTSLTQTTGALNGTKIFATHFGSDTGTGNTRRAAGGEKRGESEFVLKQNTKYLVYIKSLSAANKVGAIFAWYEHTNKTD